MVGGRSDVVRDEGQQYTNRAVYAGVDCSILSGGYFTFSKSGMAQFLSK